MKLLRRVFFISVATAFLPVCMFASTPVVIPEEHITKTTQWEGKKAGFLGDSMSDPNSTTTSRCYYNYLSDLMGLATYPYAVSGYKWKHLAGMAQRMRKEHGDSLNAVFIWAGTNDFNASTPIGTFFSESVDSVNVNGEIVERKKRTHVMSDSTLCGSINIVLGFLKHEYPHAQIVILTPIHRGYAKFATYNEQPPEEYANRLGLYIDDYVDIIRQAGNIWSVPVIDLFSESGLLPAESSQDSYIANPATDRLHPNDRGQYRIARMVQFHLLNLPDWK